jgi:hypothetical protein
MLTVALAAGDLSLEQLEQYYWDCDTAFMKGELGGQDTWSCLAITDEFQSYFADREAFMQYWEKNRKSQWLQRGYTQPKHST